MKTNRLEAFSDGVLAIIITIMVLEMKVPEGSSFAALKTIMPLFITYVFSFIYIGIYWNNHHHLMHAVNKVNGSILWANLHLLFWISLMPITTAWMGNNHFEKNPVALYGLVLFMAALSFEILAWAVIKNEGKNSTLARALKKDYKGIISLILYFIGLICSFFVPLISVAIYILVAMIWFIPDKRIEKTLKQ